MTFKQGNLPIFPIVRRLCFQPDVVMLGMPHAVHVARMCLPTAGAMCITRAVARAVWLLHLQPPLDHVLHWPALLPLNGHDAFVLTAWTLPIVAAYLSLGVLRQSQLHRVGHGGMPTAAQRREHFSVIAADELQRGSRNIQFWAKAPVDETRITFVLDTFACTAENGVWAYGVLLPAVAAVCGTTTVRPTMLNLSRYQCALCWLSPNQTVLTDQ
jgi:hypothetical protein